MSPSPPPTMAPLLLAVLDGLPESNLGRFGLGACFLFVVLYYIDRAISYPMPKDVQFIRERPGATRFSWSTRWAYLTNCKALYKEAYNKYSKNGQSVVVPGFGFRDELILPTSMVKWAASAPETTLSMQHAFVEIDQVGYSLGYDRVVGDAWQATLVRTELNAWLERTVNAMNEELGCAFDRYFGTDTDEWQEIDLLKAMQMVIAQANSRFTVGLPLCRDENFLKLIPPMNDALITVAGIGMATPVVLRPFVGRIAAIPARILKRKFTEFFTPLYQERLATLKQDANDPNHEEPQDHFQMMCRFAARERPHELVHADLMMSRLIVALFTATHQTAMFSTNMLLDILGSDPEFGTIDKLRQEVVSLGPQDAAKHGPAQQMWTKAMVSQMTKADSAARESFRLHQFGGRTLMRVVMKDTPIDGGLTLRKGGMLSFLTYPVHMDEDIYPQSGKYDPFRFSRVREAAARVKMEEDSSADGSGFGSRPLKAAVAPGAPALNLVSTSAEFLPWSHGKHACPGRFVVDFELKMIIGYVLTKYDIKWPEAYGGVRPPNYWIAEAMMVPKNVKIMVKRRRIDGK